MDALGSHTGENVHRIYTGNYELRNEVRRTFLPTRHDILKPLRAYFVRGTRRCCQLQAAAVKLFAQANVY